MKARIRAHAWLIVSGVCLMLAFPNLVFSSRAAGNEKLLDGLGFFLVLMGYVVRISSRGYKKEHSAVGGVLVQEGPYAFVRNPMYLGTLLIGTGMIMVLFRVWLFFLFLAVFAGVFLREIKTEDPNVSQPEIQSYNFRPNVYLILSQ